MTWTWNSPEGQVFELKARRRSDIYDRDPFEDDAVKEDLEDGEYDGDDDLEDEEDEDEDEEFEDEDDYDEDDDLEEDEEDEDDL